MSPFAIRLAHYIAHLSKAGLTDPMSWGELAARFKEEDRPHMVEAAYELQEEGLIRISGALNAPDGISHIRPEYELYWQFDSEVFNTNAEEDVAALIRFILDDESLGAAAKLHEKTGWGARRFNPAFARVVMEIPEGRVSQESQADYPSRHIAITPEDRVRLRRLLEDIEQSAENDKEDIPEDPAPEIEQSESPNDRLKLNFGFFEYEFGASRRIIAALLCIVVAAALFWYWPTIEKRFELGFSNVSPVLVNPPDAVTLTAFPRMLSLEWKPLSGAARYIVELELQEPSTGEWFPHPYDAKSSTGETGLSIEFIGDQLGRWRVTAVSDTGERSLPSAWREFIYQTERKP